MKLTLRKAILSTAIMGMASVSQAVEFDVQITNATNSVFFTPLLVAAHSSDYSVFTLGSEASSELQAMAEGGDISGISS